MRPKFPSMTAILLVVVGGAIHAQTFTSGSNGSDGPLELTTPGTIVFDPRSFNPPLDPDGDSIYHFTTINIGVGVVLKFRGTAASGPLFWLAQGPVTIGGTLDLNGESGHPATTVPAIRVVSTPGSGGYSGGVGRFGSSPQQDGFGPGGGILFPGSSNCGPTGRGGSFTGNSFLGPLIGGSGGGGSPSANRGGGGAGGGAILIASSTSIAISGGITANGGNRGNDEAGAGSGGAIRIAAPTISGSGTLAASGLIKAPGGGTADCYAFTASSSGVVRLEAFSLNFTGTASGVVYRASPFGVFLPGTPPLLRVVSVAGVPVPPSPTGSFTIPDITINSVTTVPFAIEARNIPVGTVVKLLIYSENGLDQTVDASPLAGTLQLSTATANAVLPSGFSRGMVRAIWTQ